MKLRQKNYLIAGILVCLAGIFLIYKNSLGKYIDPWVSQKSRYRGHISDWLVVIGIGLIIIGLFVSILAFSKDPLQKTRAN
jgi:uncharacterized membrane protein YiaA